MIRLAAHDPGWAGAAAAEAARWLEAVPGLIAVHHIGSTAVPGLPAKPILDLLPVFADAAAMEGARGAAEVMGYEWMGAFGLPGRRYCRRDDPATGRRLVHAHAYAASDPGVARHLAFRDLLRADAGTRDAYAAVKRTCADRHGDDPAAYGACKSAWIDAAEARAVAVCDDGGKTALP
ncbi:GrpB family protein [Rhodobacteraceae bacterium CCMM004]|nr:GrpB family protein [Rhodobacteraceae bacterium CCMM004]